MPEHLSTKAQGEFHRLANVMLDELTKQIDEQIAENRRLHGLVDAQYEYIGFLGKILHGHEMLAYARTGVAARPEAVAEGERLRAGIVAAGGVIPQ